MFWNTYQARMISMGTPHIVVQKFVRYYRNIGLILYAYYVRITSVNGCTTELFKEECL